MCTLHRYHHLQAASWQCLPECLICIARQSSSHSAYPLQVIFDFPAPVFKGYLLVGMPSMAGLQVFFFSESRFFKAPWQQPPPTTSDDRQLSGKSRPCPRIVRPRPVIANRFAGVPSSFSSCFMAKRTRFRKRCVVLGIPHGAKFGNVQQVEKILFAKLTSNPIDVSFVPRDLRQWSSS